MNRLICASTRIMFLLILNQPHTTGGGNSINPFLLQWIFLFQATLKGFCMSSVERILARLRIHEMILLKKGFYTWVNDSIRGTESKVNSGQGLSSDRETIECIRSVYQGLRLCSGYPSAVAMDVYDNVYALYRDLTPTVIAFPLQARSSLTRAWQKALFEDEAGRP